MDRFENDNWSVDTDKALDKLFGALPLNCSIAEVYLKVVALDDLYSTGLRRGRKEASALYDIAKEICQLAIDSELARRLPEVVDRVAAVEVGGKRCGYVFASKYSHFHAPDDYPIYESSVVEPLVYAYQKSDERRVRHNDLMKNYTKYKGAVKDLRGRYGLADIDFRRFDKFLLGYGRDWKATRPR